MPATGAAALGAHDRHFYYYYYLTFYFVVRSWPRRLRQLGHLHMQSCPPCVCPEKNETNSNTRSNTGSNLTVPNLTGTKINNINTIR